MIFVSPERLWADPSKTYKFVMRRMLKCGYPPKLSYDTEIEDPNKKMGVLERWFPNQCEAKIRHQSEESGEQFLYKVSNDLVWNFWIPLMKMNCNLITNFIRGRDAFQALI